jgi:uncharacterized protein
MIQHLTPADYVSMPWANGRGQTVELVRQNYIDGRLFYRLSMATVSEDGPFSLFPGINRSLTVIDGPGFDLVGEQRRLRADPLVPVAFPGDWRVSAAKVRGTSQDFNVMACRAHRMKVSIQREGKIAGYLGELVFYFALAPAQVGRWSLTTHDLLYGRPRQTVDGGPVILVQIE